MRTIRIPQKPEVFHCGSMGIDADCVNPHVEIVISPAEIGQGREQVSSHEEGIAVVDYRLRSDAITLGIRQSFIWSRV
jgi:hypothetical protein